ncbi:DUF952 domain-containing protein [Pseudooctadecabacter jejudonensis]|uniref:DUF952 domain-containing protein n=1 Tax=Pseudooctadecabacter jejudonensis TaxID=1391910 RepID=A0A1Y5SK18_9RHOB|nr:DUF952 domain-containing protein [Pseudooctadecabacter jejudonensis]SLN42230.1 hypothetical protein PSJ8397_02142 [Pseudooctadecabacter jejudonensis]
MLIYKILTADQWADFERTGTFTGAPIDLADGYIHTSTADQAQETADKHFAGQEGLMLAALDAATYGEDLKWEVSRGGAEFPHIYNRPLRMEEVIWARPMPLVDGTHALDFT